MMHFDKQELAPIAIVKCFSTKFDSTTTTAETILWILHWQSRLLRLTYFTIMSGVEGQHLVQRNDTPAVVRSSRGGTPGAQVNSRTSKRPFFQSSDGDSEKNKSNIMSVARVYRFTRRCSRPTMPNAQGPIWDGVRSFCGGLSRISGSIGCGPATHWYCGRWFNNLRPRSQRKSRVQNFKR